MIVGVPKEIAPRERRVALIPAALSRLAEVGLEVQVETRAGVASGSSDAEYEAAGARVQPDAAALYAAADIVAKVQPPQLPAEVELLPAGAVLLCVLQPFAHPDAVRALARRGVTSLALDLMPRITRAQSMDVLSSMSTVAGYECVLIAARALPRFFPLMHTAAGTLKPARVLVIGAGVAGLQAIATARRLGAVVEAFDIRAAVKEQVESLGARFVEQGGAEDAEGAGGYAKEQTAEQLAAQRELLASRIAACDVVICTALVPGRRAPVLVSGEQVKGMHLGSVIVDLAAEQGGNCELTRPGEVVEAHGVQIHGPLNVPSHKSVHASQMFARNVSTYLAGLVDDGELRIELEDELVSGPLVTHQGRIVNEAVRAELEG